jgi:hypothetical protein
MITDGVVTMALLLPEHAEAYLAGEDEYMARLFSGPSCPPKH